MMGKVAADIGASTGGFTDCMLQNGAAKVYAIDVGYGQLAWKLRTDDRVVNMERTNIRNVTLAMLEGPLDFASIDVAFISLTKVLPVAYELLKDGGEIAALIKPQFEAGKEKVGKKGIIKVSDKFFTDEEISRLSVVAPKAVLNIIRDYEVVEKKTVETPDELRGIIKCNNPVCITNNEPMPTVFHVVDKEHGICKCHYCDKEQDMNRVELC
jgi:aspartate carbamoyltransferase regulatory subunit